MLSREARLMALTTAGEVDSAELAWVSSCVASSFPFETCLAAPMPHPLYAWDAARAQYSSPLVLREALGLRPADAVKMLVVTECDLFIPMLSFVYGQAQVDGPLAIVSFARLRQEFYGLPSNRPLFLLRVRKEVQHEIGHTLGLTHCDDPLCTMRISTNIQQLDAKRDEFCTGCAILVGDAFASLPAAAAGGGR